MSFITTGDGMEIFVEPPRLERLPGQAGRVLAAVDDGGLTSAYEQQFDADLLDFLAT